MKRQRRNGERGFALAMMALGLLTFFAMIVIAVDVGRFSHTASEMQAIADLAALSGAKSVLVRGAGTAQSGADTAARRNTFDGRTFIDDGTVGTLPVDEGCYTPPAAGCSTDCQGSFTPTGGGACPQGQFEAVRATATGNAVQVITAGLIPGSPQQLNITRRAIAAIVGINAVAATLPVALCPQLLAQLQPGQTCLQDATLKQLDFSAGRRPKLVLHESEHSAGQRHYVPRPASP